ncbi:MFS transporter [Rhizobium ruizarguesonis]|uniref:MFS transporter n=1 Tax=Rhizobium ruizarguesonis TaxID=2081791 RepID=UPI00103037A1|nr:MFS transporter [Rhizobium ruizarguesonis]TAT96115.1 MFS transporter [Rhizobium ruizarguesonis]
MFTSRDFGPLTTGITASRPYLVVAALLLASFVVGLDTRVFAVGIPDLRGPMRLSFDEASWLSTFANAPQILISAAVAWLATVFGVRRVMIPSTLIYAGISLVIPMLHGGETLLVLHSCRALLLGLFLPATIMVMFRNLDTKYWLIGIAIYTLRVPLAQYLGVVLVGIYGDYLGWQWLYWQDVIFAPIVATLLIVSAPREEINRDLLARADWGGMLLLGSAMMLLYIAFDQGNRLDWLESGLIISLLVAGGFLAAAFLINESFVRHPWAHASVILSRNIGVGYTIIIAFACSAAGASIAIPAYIQNVSGLRPIALSGVYTLCGVFPVLLATILAVILQRRIDARLCVIAGFLAMAMGSLIGSHLTSSWTPWSFIPVLLLQSVGQSFAFFATVLYLIANSDPKRSTAVSAYIQVIRIVGVEFAGSLMTTWLRYREQFHSNTLGQTISASSRNFDNQVMKLQGVLGEGMAGKTLSTLHVVSAVRSQAFTLTYADSFLISFWFAVAALFLVACLGAAPYGPLHHRFRHSK